MKPAFLALSAALAAALIVTSGCASRGSSKKDTAYIARDVETIYSLAHDTMMRARYRDAAQLFDEVERQHPYSVWARRAQVMAAFNYYAARKYSDAILGGQQFLSLHPGSKEAPYVHYIIALSYYEQIANIARDQKTTRQAKDAFEELIQLFPDSPYARDARLKLDLVNDHLAGKEMEIGRFYAGQRNWIAATRRYQAVIKDYQTTSQVPEALFRLTEAYLAIGIPEEARRNAAVLGANYPGSVWYERSYSLLKKHGIS